MKQKVLYVAALMLLSSSFGMAKKKVEDPEITKLKAKIENVMSQVDKQPDWLYSRLQMFWKTNASDVFVNGEAFAHPGGERNTMVPEVWLLIIIDLSWKTWCLMMTMSRAM